MMNSEDPTRRFSGRVADYARYRPGYPAELADVLGRELGLGGETVVADVGAGTGLSSEPFLDVGCSVVAVEPNDEMRAAAEGRFAGNSRFRIVGGRAEATGLDDRSVDVVAAGQAFHWFDPDPTREEFDRVLRPGGVVLLFWNGRRTDTPFHVDYEALLDRFAIDTRHLSCRRGMEDDITGFFALPPARWSFTNAQQFDLAGLTGRLTSSSYTPRRDHPTFEPMLRALADVFAAHAAGGEVTFEYETELFAGTV